MRRRIFTASPLTGSTTIFLLSIGDSPVTGQFFASPMRAMNRDCYHEIFHLSPVGCSSFIMPFSCEPLPVDEHLDELRSRQSEERDIGLVSYGPGEQRFASARRANVQDAPVDLATKLLESHRIFQEPHDLNEFCYCLINTRHIGKGRLGFAVHVEPRPTLAKGEEAALGSRHPPTYSPEEQDHHDNGSEEKQDIQPEITTSTAGWQNRNGHVMLLQKRNQIVITELGHGVVNWAEVVVHSPMTQVM